MKLLNRFLKKDKFLEELNRFSVLYQEFFNRIEKIADDKIWAKFILDPKFALSDESTNQIEKEEKKIELILKEVAEKGLNQIVLLVAYLQYATADPLFDQNTKKSYWISVVLNRKSIDSFPHHDAIINYLEQYGYIGAEYRK